MNCIMGVRSLIGFNPVLCNNIKMLIKNQFIYSSVKILKNELEIREAFYYCARHADNKSYLTSISFGKIFITYIADLFDLYLG